MKCPNHLGLKQIELTPSAEWAAAFPGWCFFQVQEGQGYWIGDGGARQLGAGDVAVLSPLREGLFRSKLRRRSASSKRIDASDPRVRLELQPDGTVRPVVTASASPKK